MVRPQTDPEQIKCPLCEGAGSLSGDEIIKKTGMKDISRVAEITATKALALAHDSLWNKYEAKLNQQVADRTDKLEQKLRSTEADRANLEKQLKVEAENARKKQLADDQAANAVALEKLQNELARIKGELAQAQGKVSNLPREVELAREATKQDLSRQLTSEQEANKRMAQELGELRMKLAATAVQGRVEERSFEEEVREWPQFHVSDKLARNGDYILSLRDASGASWKGSELLIDNKDKDKVAADDLTKLIRDIKQRKYNLGAIVASDENVLRSEDREKRWCKLDGVWVLRTTRQWLRRDLDLLLPVMQRMAEEGPGFLEREKAISVELNSYLVELADLEAALKKAAEYLTKAMTLCASYRGKVEKLCRRPANADTQGAQAAQAE
ncbi:MAG: hypothetical protein IT462_13660 [Planctomycetes bacterium]|nr:hypothetical protein [Planctomycetota bacterium]